MPGTNGMLDGKAMFETLDKADADVRSISTDEAERLYRELEASPLVDGCSADDFSGRINRFVRDINPYLEEPKGDEAISR